MEWNKAKEILESNPEVKKELEENKEEFQLIHDIIATRNEQHLTQKELADKVGTKQSNIARFESGNYNPSLEFLQKLAKAMGKKIKISLV